MRSLISSWLARIRNRPTPSSPSVSAAHIQQPGDTVRPVQSRGLFHCLFHDPLLLSAFAICLLLIAYQAGASLLHPAWLGSATDWLRAALALPELLILVGVSVSLSRA